MSAALAQFHFLRPLWLCALAVLPWLVWQASRRARGVQALSRLVDAELLPQLLYGRAVGQRLPLVLLALAWLLAVLALAGPTWSRTEQPLYARRAAQVVAISLSQSMLSRDVVPSRIDRAHYKAHELLMANQDGLNALIGYAGEAFVVAPLTSDVHSLSTLLDAMAPDIMPVNGNDAAAAINRGVALIRDAKVDGGSLVLITDTAGPSALAAARRALAAGVRVSVLGVGTPQGAPVTLPGGGFLHDAQGNLQLAPRDDAALAAVAAAGGGRYVPMSTGDGDIAVLKGELRAGATRAAHGRFGDEWQDRGPWLLLLLLPLAALSFRRGWLLLLPLVLLPMLPATAHATDWHDLWQNRNQQAAAALRQGDPKQALQLANDPALRGTAAYRAGDYARAAQAWQGLPGSGAAYDLGNALAREGKYEDAIRAYDEALKRDPGNADAKANKQAVEDWLRKQRKPPQEQQKNQSSSQQQKRGGSSSSQGQGNSGQGGNKPQDKGEQNQKNGQGKSDQSRQGQNQQSQAAQGKPGQDKNGQDKSDQGHNGQDKGNQDNSKAQSGQSQQQGREAGQQDRGNPADAAGQSSQNQQMQGNRSSSGNSGMQQDKPQPLTPAQQAAQQAQIERAQQALKRQLDQQLGMPGQAAANLPPTHQLGVESEGNPQSRLPEDLRQALQRVPDDPGGLLRRKFELEYQRRQGDAPDEDGP